MIKLKKRKILLLPGDGIGPEVIQEVRKTINWFNSKKSLDFENSTLSHFGPPTAPNITTALSNAL